MLFPYAYTAPINPTSTTITLTKDEVWKCLMEKARNPQDYIPVISHCEIVSEDKDGLVRMVNFPPGYFNGGGLVKEEVTWVENVRVDYITPGDQPWSVSNILSDGAGDGDLHLTFIFELNKDVEPGSLEEKQIWDSFRSMAGKSVEGTIKSAREKKAQGLL